MAIAKVYSPFLFYKIVNYPLLSRHRKGLFLDVPAFFVTANSTCTVPCRKLLQLESAMSQSSSPPPQCMAFFLPPNSSFRASRPLSGPHRKKQFAGSLKPAGPLKLTKCLLDLLPNQLALFLR